MKLRTTTAARAIFQEDSFVFGDNKTFGPLMFFYLHVDIKINNKYLLN